jgi:hypothetical protein
MHPGTENISFSDEGSYMCKLFRPQQVLSGNNTGNYDSKTTNFSVRVTVPFKMGLHVSGDDDKMEVTFQFDFFSFLFPFLPPKITTTDLHKMEI